MASSSNTAVFGLIVGAMTISGVTVGFCQSHLPSQTIKELNGLIDETQGLYESAMEGGYLTNGTLRRQIEETFAKLRDDTQNLRSRAYSATTLLKDYHELFRGLSYSIWVACHQVKKLRALIITTRRAEQHRAGIYTGDYSPVWPSSSWLAHQSSRVTERYIPQPQLDLLPVDHLHAGRTMIHAAPHTPFRLHDIETFLMELNDSATRRTLLRIIHHFSRASLNLS